MNVPGFTAVSSLYLSTRSYTMMRSVPSAENSRLIVTPQQDSTFVPPCSNPLGGCYPAPDGSFLSICPCGSPGTCGPCFDLAVEGYDLGSKSICLCESVSVPPDRCDTMCGGIVDHCRRQDCYCTCEGGTIHRDPFSRCGRTCGGLP